VLFSRGRFRAHHDEGDDDTTKEDAAARLVAD
jgi:hypothetical protein